MRRCPRFDPHLAQLMIRHGVVVKVKWNVQIVEVDEDYFE